MLLYNEMDLGVNLYQAILHQQSAEDVATLLSSTSAAQRTTYRKALFLNLYSWYQPRGLTLNEELPTSTLLYLLQLEELFEHPEASTELFAFEWNRDALLPLSNEQFNALVTVVLNETERLLTAKSHLSVYQPSLINLFFLRAGISEELKARFLQHLKRYEPDEYEYLHIKTWIVDPYLFNFDFYHLTTNRPEVLDLTWPLVRHQRLLSLDLTGAGLTAVPAKLNLFEELIELNLSHNLIQVLPSDSESWPISLYTLDVSYNQIRSFPSQFILEVYPVETLNLSHNLLEDREDPYQPGKENQAIELSSLNISSCGLTKLPSLLISDSGPTVIYHELRELDASKNYLTTFVHLGARHGSDSDRNFNLSYNRIEQVVAMQDPSSAKYERLNLSHNRLRSFILPVMIHKLDLSYNPVSTLEVLQPDRRKRPGLKIHSTFLPQNQSYGYSKVSVSHLVPL